MPIAKINYTNRTQDVVQKSSRKEPSWKDKLQITCRSSDLNPISSRRSSLTEGRVSNYPKVGEILTPPAEAFPDDVCKAFTSSITHADFLKSKWRLVVPFCRDGTLSFFQILPEKSTWMLTNKFPPVNIYLAPDESKEAQAQTNEHSSF